jgi:NADH:ubiquinone reductase (non-electrogenic)
MRSALLPVRSSCLQVFTPLLASTAVGTLEFRSVALPVRDIQPALSLPLNSYLTAWARAINTADKYVSCVTTDGVSFNQPYDKLVIATGAAGSTFGIPGDSLDLVSSQA